MVYHSLNSCSDFSQHMMLISAAQVNARESRTPRLGCVVVNLLHVGIQRPVGSWPCLSLVGAVRPFYCSSSSAL